MSNRCLLICIWIVCFWGSCSSSERKTLNTAYAILESHPDSALAILETVRPESLRCDRDKACYALLKSMALDKNYIDVSDDSLINIAASYYSRSEHPVEYMKTSYMQGRIYKNGRRFPASISAFQKAEDLAIKVGDDHYLGLIERNIANVFSLCNNNISAIEYHKRAIEAFEKEGNKKYADHARHSLAIDFFNNNDLKQSDSLLNYLRHNTEDPSLLALANLRHASILLINNDSLAVAESLFRKTPQKYYKLLDYGFFATNLYLMGAPEDSVDYWLREGYKKCQTLPETASLDFLSSRISALRGNYPAAYKEVSNALSVQDSLTRVLLTESLSQAQRDYYKQELSIDNERSRRERLITLMTVLALVCTIVIVVLTSTIQNQKKDLLLKDSLARLSVSQKMNGKLTGAYCYERMARLSTLADTYFSFDDRNERNRVLNDIKHYVTEIRKSRDFFNTMEDELNRNCSNVIQKLRTQVPAIKGDNLKIAMLFMAGFSAESIMIIMSRQSVGSLRTLRSRLRNSIKNASSKDMTLFLNMLSEQ